MHKSLDKVRSYTRFGPSMTDWEQYGIPSNLVEVKSDSQFGRGVYTKTSLQRGREVLKVDPYVCVLSNEKGVRLHFCDNCLRELPGHVLEKRV